MDSIDNADSSVRHRQQTQILEYQPQNAFQPHAEYAHPSPRALEQASEHLNDNYRNSMDDEIRRRIAKAEANRDMFIQDHAPRMAKLGVFSTGCLIVNRMIGTGIFETPGTVWMSTETVAGSLFMWFLGGLISYAGLLVYLELGLTVPRYKVRGTWRSIPRSGGEKNYVSLSRVPVLFNVLD